MVQAAGWAVGTPDDVHQVVGERDKLRLAIFQ